jgi:predicted transposase YdaD
MKSSNHQSQPKATKSHSPKQPVQFEQNQPADQTTATDQDNLAKEIDFFHPHDSFFRSYFKDPQVFTSLVQAVVPQEVSNTLDFSTLSFDSDTFVGIDYRNHFSDLVATVMTKVESSESNTTPTTPVKIYLLAEHKSYNDPKALLQLLRYKLELWEKETKDQYSRPLTPVIPILFHHGPAKEVHSEFTQLFEPLVDQSLLNYIPKFTVGLMNVTAMGEEEFPPDPKLSLALWSFKYAKTQAKKVVQKIATIAENLGKLQEFGTQVDQVGMYIIAVSPLTYDQYLDMINEYLENEITRKELMFRPNTMIAKEAKRHHEIGLQEGFQQGKSQGLAEGVKQGMEQGIEKGASQQQEQVIENMRKKGFSDQEITEITGIKINQD